MVLLHAVLEPLHWLLVSAIHCILTFHWLRQTVPFVLNGPVLISSRLLNRCTSLKTHLYRPVRNEQRCCSATEWLQEGLQKSCKRAGCSSSKFWLFRTAVESPLTAINSAVVAVQKIPESRSALQSGCKVSSKRQRMLLLLMAYHSLVQKRKRNTDFNNTIIMRHGRGVDKAFRGVKTTRKSKCNWYFISIHAYTLQNQVTYNKSATVSLCKYSAITVTHLNVRTSINMQTLKVIFFLK